MSGQCSDNSAMPDLNSPSQSDSENPRPGAGAQPPPDAAFRGSIFMGPDGLRAGWRLLIYFLFYGALLYVGRIILGALSAAGITRLWFYMVAEFIPLLAAVLPAMLMAPMEGRRLGDYGLPRRQAFGKLFWLGSVWGLAAISVLLAIMHEIPVQQARVFDFGHLAIHGVRLLKFAAFWGLFFLLVGFYEEFHFRGYTLFTLFAGLDFRWLKGPANSVQSGNSDTLSFWSAAALLSVYFGGVHLFNPGENLTGVLAVAFIGLFFCLTVRRTGSLWFAVGFHAAFDWGETYLYSVPDSGTMAPGHLLSSSFHGPAWLTGGTVGPEGSVLVFVMIAVLWVVFARFYPEVKYQISRADTAPAHAVTYL